MNPTTRHTILVQFKATKEWAIRIIFPFDYGDVDKVKTLPGRKFNSEKNYWTCPLAVDNVEKLREWKFALDPRLEQYLEAMEAKKLNVAQVDALEVPGLKMQLYPFQKKGVAFIEAKNGRALLADSMGLGKTCQALAWLQLHPEKRPVIIVVPASLKLNWEREIKMWLSKYSIQILSGTAITTKLTAEFIIINYDILSAWIKPLQAIHPAVLIMDECHFVKSNKAKRTKAVKKLAKSIPHVLALSGTPIVNRPVEAFNAIKLIDPSVVGSYWEYAHRYCGAKNNGYGWDMSGSSHTEELHEKLTNTIMIRRKKVDVLPDLPEKVRSFIPMELANRKEYEYAEDNFVAFIKDEKGKEAAERASNAAALVEIEALKQLAVRGKMKQAVEWIRNFIDIDGKLVVFATHKFVIEALIEEFGDKAVKIDGSVTGANRQLAVDRFQTDDSVRLFIGNIKAAGVGITLTASSNVAFLELGWASGEHEQAEDRCHRIGQKNSVNIYYLLADNTIEERIARLIDKKRKILDAILDGQKTEETSLLSELMSTYNPK